jgi:acetate kinase
MDAILVVNAGSSSVKFSGFFGLEEIDLAGYAGRARGRCRFKSFAISVQAHLLDSGGHRLIHQSRYA